MIGKSIYKTETGLILVELSPGLKGWTGGKEEKNSLVIKIGLNLNSNKQYWWVHENTIFNPLIMNTE